MLTSRILAVPTLIVLLAVGVSASLVAPARAGDGIDSRAVARAHAFLRTEQRGRDVLSSVHFGATYHGHQYQETRLLNDRAGNRLPGCFALVYEFRWQDDGITDVAFLCDPRGSVCGVQVVSTNAVLQQPFLAANAAIQVVGNATIAACKDDMKANDRRVVQKMVDDADAKSLLEWSLRFEQAVGQ